MFVFGIALSASGQTTAAPAGGTAPAATPPQQPRTLQLPPYIASGTPLTMEDAVKMALENNL
ncbi:MAG TPA: hypothetical protein VH138_02210, partial [Vicinamibacterales bacterium]|nr:hypothetical protein [Vicinamibacterales bacterium]